MKRRQDYKSADIPVSLKLSRIILLVAYFGIHMPGIMGPKFHESSPLAPASIFIFFFILMVFYIVIESTEQFVPRLSFLKGWNGWLIRLIPVLISILVMPQEIHMFIFIPICIYYAAMELPKSPAIVMTAAVFIISFFLDRIFPMDLEDAPEKIAQFLQTFLVLFRTAKLLFMYAMGYLWKIQVADNRTKTELVDKLNKSNKQIQTYADKIADTMVLEERNRLAQEIHDSIGHYLTAIQIQLSKAVAFYEKDKSTSLKAVTDARSAAADAMKDVRLSVKSLKEEDRFVLRDAMNKLFERVKNNDIAVARNDYADLSGASHAVQMAFYRVTQEALTNIMKHSAATEISLRTVIEGSSAHLYIHDNGRGFDTASLSEGHGLPGLKQRLELVRGTLTITSSEGAGTAIEASAPLNPAELEEI